MQLTAPSLALLRFHAGDVAGALVAFFECQFQEPHGDTDAAGMVAIVRELTMMLHAAGAGREAERVRTAAMAAFKRAAALGTAIEGDAAAAAGAGKSNGKGGDGGRSDAAPIEKGDASGMEWLEPETFSPRDLILEPESTLGIQLDQAALWIKNAARYRLLDIDCPTGLLFTGPTGTGKTTAAHYLAWRCGRPCGIARHDALGSRFIGQNLKNLRAMIEEAIRRGALLFFDEVDTIARDRRLAGPNDSHRIEMCNSLLEQLGLLRKNHPEQVVIAATNHPEVLDDAFVRRVAITIEFGFLGDAARHELVTALYTHVDVDDEARELLVLRSGGKSGDYLRSLAMTAARAAVAALPEEALAILDQHRDAAAAPPPPEGAAPALPVPLPPLPRPRVLRAHVAAALAVVRDQAEARRKSARRRADPEAPRLITG